MESDGWLNGRVNLGICLRRLRIDAGMSGRELAEVLGWPPSKISKIELGRQVPSSHVVEWARDRCGNRELSTVRTGSRSAPGTAFGATHDGGEAGRGVGAPGGGRATVTSSAPMGR